MIFYKSESYRSSKELKMGGYLRLITFVFGLILIWSLWQGWEKIRLGQERIAEAESELEIKRHEQEEWQNKVDEVKDRDYMEKVIRDDLKMQRSGEVVVVLPSMPVKYEEQRGQSEEVWTSNWEKWWSLVR